MRNPFEAKHINNCILSLICQDDVIDINSMSHYYTYM